MNANIDAKMANQAKKIEEYKAIASKILTNSEMEFAEMLLKETAALYVGDKMLKLAFCSAIKDYTPEKKEYVKQHFGAEVYADAELLQRISKINVPNHKTKIQSLRKVFIELANDLKIIILKLYERLVALKVADKKKSPELNQLAEECLNLYAPIAHRLGIRNIYNQMEDISFKALHTYQYKRLVKIIESRRDEFTEKLESMAKILRKQMQDNNINCDVQYRVKRPYSIYKKLVNKNIDINEVYDLLALRVITDKVDNCYLALGIVHRNWIPIEDRFKDWVTFPKPNGYRSIQTTVLAQSGSKFEIQIRTEEMHREAEYGSAAHWAYKEKVDSEADWISKLKEFLENDEYFNNAEALDELLKMDYKKKHIHILTPKGDVISIPEGSTILDFAHRIHTDVLLTCVGGRINGKFVKLKTELKTGDIVEVLTNKNSKPSRDWLQFIKSPGARAKVVLWLKKNESTQIAADGKRAWERFKKDNRRKIAGFDDEADFRENLVSVGYKNQEDFFMAIGTGSLKLSVTLLRKLYPKAFEKSKEMRIKDKAGKVSNKIDVIVDGLTNIDTTIAKCCNPIRGQKIVAYVTQRSGIKIHSADCQWIDGMEAERIKSAVWVNSETMQTAKMRVYGNEYATLLSAVVETSSAIKISLISIEKVFSGNDLECIEVTVQVKNIDELANYSKKLMNSPFISSTSQV